MEVASPLNPAIEHAIDDALRPMFGEKLPVHYAEQGRHQAEVLDLIEGRSAYNANS